MADKDPEEVFNYYQQGIAKSDPGKYGTDGTISRLLTYTPDSEETKLRNEYRLQNVKRQQRLAIQQRTDARVDFYRQKLGYYPAQDQQNNSATTQRSLRTRNRNNRTSSSTTSTENPTRANEIPPAGKQSGSKHVTPSSAAQTSNFPPPGSPNCQKRSTASSSTQTLQGDIKPFRTFPLCQQNNLYWKIAIKDESGITWTRFKPNGNQEWLTGSIRPDECWQFNISKEINDIFPS